MNPYETTPLKYHTEFIQYERLENLNGTKVPIWVKEDLDDAWYQAFLKMDLQTLRSVIKDLLADCISKRYERTLFRSLLKAEKALLAAMEKLDKLPKAVRRQKTHQDEFWAYSNISDMLELDILSVHSEYCELFEEPVYWVYN